MILKDELFKLKKGPAFDKYEVVIFRQFDKMRNDENVNHHFCYYMGNNKVLSDNFKRFIILDKFEYIKSQLSETNLLRAFYCEKIENIDEIYFLIDEYRNKIIEKFVK